MPSDREPTMPAARPSAGADGSRDLIVVRLAFRSFAKVCFLISGHVGALAAILFVLTNGGRRVSFGTSQFFGAAANAIGSLFLLVVMTLGIGLAALLAYLPIQSLMRLTGGLRLRASSRDSTHGEGPRP